MIVRVLHYIGQLKDNVTDLALQLLIVDGNFAPIPDLPDKKIICIIERKGTNKMSGKERKQTAAPRYDEVFKAGAGGPPEP